MVNPISVRTLATPDQAAIEVADILTQTIEKPRLGLATGGTPRPVYQLLIKRVAEGTFSMAGIETFNLDEYVGLWPEHPQSYHAFMRRELFDHVDIDRASTHLPRGDANDADAEAQRYEAALRRRPPLDIQLLGIGRNGHIGFNEPGSSLDSVTRVVDLTEDTIAANARFFDDSSDVPRRAITMGIATILRAKKIVLLATGSSKASAVASAIHGEITPNNPASFLQTHGDVTFVLDQAASPEGLR